ncbi:hypothetical protein B0H17DRAFT_1142632 [Mycena rosella]|uniref:Uncharacterized protein n=1 Tax=Mycena rosella TaxID=1033263 RepID=A0AAD7G8U4_MYCRO|nr:hypothetical protein B0H17DRAFT_1142632 [Mycena rosella]
MAPKLGESQFPTQILYQLTGSARVICRTAIKTRWWRGTHIGLPTRGRRALCSTPRMQAGLPDQQHETPACEERTVAHSTNSTPRRRGMAPPTRERPRTKERGNEMGWRNAPSPRWIRCGPAVFRPRSFTTVASGPAKLLVSSRVVRPGLMEGKLKSGTPVMIHLRTLARHSACYQTDARGDGVEEGQPVSKQAAARAGRPLTDTGDKGAWGLTGGGRRGPLWKSIPFNLEPQAVVHAWFMLTRNQDADQHFAQDNPKHVDVRRAAMKERANCPLLETLQSGADLEFNSIQELPQPGALPNSVKVTEIRTPEETLLE